jgi:hypothetical protein
VARGGASDVGACWTLTVGILSFVILILIDLTEKTPRRFAQVRLKRSMLDPYPIDQGMGRWLEVMVISMFHEVQSTARRA